MAAYDAQTLTTTTEMAAVAEVAYRDRDGAVRLRPITPLLLRGEPAFTLSYADSGLARELAASPRTCLVFSDSRFAYVGWSPLAVEARVEVAPDPEGDLFREELLHQEVRKFPPDRQLIDSPLLQRENWWYLPRWIVRVAEAKEPRPLVRRADPDHGVLAYYEGGALTAETVLVEDWDADRIPVRLPGGPGPPLAQGSPAALFYHDFAIPDMDPRVSFLATGRLENGRLSVAERSGSRVLGKRPGLLTRWRAQRDLERRCKAGLEEQAGSNRGRDRG